MGGRSIILPWESQPQERVELDRDHPLGAITENVWLPTDLSGVAIGLGSKATPHADVVLSQRWGKRFFYNNDANEAGTGATIKPIAFPRVQFCQFVVDAVPGFVTTIPMGLSGGSFYYSFLGCGSSTFLSMYLRYGGTARTVDLTVTGGTLGKLLSCVFLARSETDVDLYVNGQVVSGVSSPGTLGSELVTAGGGQGQMNGGVFISGYARGMIPGSYALELSINPDLMWQMFAPISIRVPVAGAAGSYTLTAAAGSFTLTGNAAGLKANRRVTAAAGSFTLTGNAAGLYRGLRLSAAAGTYAWTGNAANLVAQRKLLAAAGSYALTGNAAVLRAGRMLAMASGSYTFTGQAAGLSKTGSYSLAADAGSYAFNGQNVALLAGRKLVAGAGSFALTGQAATLRVSRRLAADVGSFALSGQDLALRAARRLSAGTGVFNLTGSAAQLLRGYHLAATAGTYAFTGNAAVLAKTGSYSLTAGAGAYAWTGIGATLTYSGEIFTDSEFWKYTVPAQPLLFTVPAQDLRFTVPADPLAFTI